jgi:hypothetical protein
VVKLIKKYFRYLFESVCPECLEVVLWTWAANGARVLVEVALELLNFIFLLLLVVCAHFLPEQTGAFVVVEDGSQLLDADSVLLFGFCDFVLEGVLGSLAVRHILDEILSSCVLVKVVVFYLLVVVSKIFAFLLQTFIHSHPHLGRALACCPEELLDASSC